MYVDGARKDSKPLGGDTLKCIIVYNMIARTPFEFRQPTLLSPTSMFFIMSLFKL